MSLLWSLGFASLLAVTVKASPSVSLGHAQIVGLESQSSHVEFFGGIPYAQPPLGGLRFLPPILANGLPAGRFNAQVFGPSCLQNGLPANSMSEDCLTLNIFRPAGLSSDSKIPVMVWIYGGGFFAGGSSLYNGTEIVERGAVRGTPVIFASINYRLGPLGFPQGLEASERGALNLGLQDQLAGLQWIQENIEHFGGDKARVTIFGQSAGASSINFHLLRTKIRQVARAAILESVVSGPIFGPQHKEDAWQEFVEAVPACAFSANTNNTFDCLRSVDSKSILDALSTTSAIASSFQPVIDGPGGLIPDRLSRIVPEARLPVLIGTNLDEWTPFTPQGVSSTQDIRSSFLNQISNNESTIIDQILLDYPDIPSLGCPFGTGNDTFGLNSQYKRFAAIFGDFLIQSVRRTFAQNMVAAGVKIHAYLFTDPDAVVIGGLLSPSAAPGSIGVGHSAEIDYVFDTLVNKTPTARSLSKNMQDYWISFATSLDPNDKHGNTNRPLWGEYLAADQKLLELNSHDTRMISDNYRGKQIALFQDNPDALQR